MKITVSLTQAEADELLRRQVYAALGHGDQSAERIAERGGFGGGEILRMLAERDPWSNSGWEPLTERQQRRLSGIRTAGLEAL